MGSNWQNKVTPSPRSGSGIDIFGGWSHGSGGHGSGGYASSRCHGTGG